MKKIYAIIDHTTGCVHTVKANSQLEAFSKMKDIMNKTHRYTFKIL